MSEGRKIKKAWKQERKATGKEVSLKEFARARGGTLGKKWLANKRRSG